MGAIQDLLQEVPLSAVLKERVALAEQKLERATSENADLKQRIRELEEENAALRELIPTEELGGLNRDTASPSYSSNIPQLLAGGVTLA